MNLFLDKLYWKFSKRKKYLLNEVYTASSPAEVNYVSRQILETEFKKQLESKGKQIIIYGHSGSGKTTLTRKMLREANRPIIITPCGTNITFNELLVNAFDELNPYYLDSMSKRCSETISDDISITFKEIQCQLKSISQTSIDESHKRIIPIQLTPTRLSQFLGNKKCCWVIEDFHKLSKEEINKLADCLKVFVDQSDKYPETKIICIGTSDSINELIHYDTNLNTRISEIEIPLLSDEENRLLITNGCRLLNIQMDSSMIEQIIQYSNQIASIAHQMCFDICYHSGIDSTQKSCTLIPLENFQHAIESFIRTQKSRLGYLYEGAISKNIGWYILRTLASSKGKIPLQTIVQKVNSNGKRIKFSITEITEKLKELSIPDIGIVKFDSNANRYCLSSPFWGAFIKMQQRIEYERSIQVTNKKKSRKNIRKEEILNCNTSETILNKLLLSWIEQKDQYSGMDVRTLLEMNMNNALSEKE